MGTQERAADLDLKAPVESAEDAQETRKTAGSGVVIFAARIGAKALTLVFRLLVVRLYGASAYGIFAFGVVLVDLFGMFAPAGFDRAMLRYGVKYRGEDDRQSYWALLRAMSRMALILGTLVACGVFVFADWIAVVSKKPEIASLLRVFAPAFPAIAVGHVMLAALQARQNVRIFSILQQVLPVFVLLVGFGAAYALDLSYAGIAVAKACSWAAPGLVAWVLLSRFASKPSEYTPGAPASIPLKEIAAFALRIVLFVGAFPLVMNLDRIMIGLLLESKNVGIYDIAASLSVQISMIFGVVCTIVYPKIGDMYTRGQIDKLQDFLHSSTRWTILLTTFAMFVTVLVRYDLMALFGKEFLGSGTHILFVLCASQWTHAAFGPVSGILTMTGHERALFHSTILMAVVNGVLNAVLLQWIGVVGAAYATIIAVAFWNFVVLRSVHKLCGLRYHSFSQLRPLVVGAALFLVCEGVAWAVPFFGVRLALAAVFGLVYAGLSYRFDMNAQERALVGSVRERVLRRLGR